MSETVSGFIDVEHHSVRNLSNKIPAFFCNDAELVSLIVTISCEHLKQQLFSSPCVFQPRLGSFDVCLGWCICVSQLDGSRKLYLIIGENLDPPGDTTTRVKVVGDKESPLCGQKNLRGMDSSQLPKRQTALQINKGRIHFPT